ncbi:serine hydrolase [Nanoarchaeota archaeon]
MKSLEDILQFLKKPRVPLVLGSMAAALFLPGPQAPTEEYVELDPIVAEAPPVKKILDSQAKRYLDRARAEGLLKDDERVAIVGYDLLENEPLVNHNGDELVQLASIVKIPVAAAYFHLVNEGELTYRTQSQDSLTQMLRNSHNEANNWFVRRMGGAEKVDSLLQEFYPNIFQDVHITDTIPTHWRVRGREYKNRDTGQDLTTFQQELWKGNIPGHEEILGHMRNAKYKRLLENTSIIPENDYSYEKTGSTLGALGTTGIVVMNNGVQEHPYALTIIVERTRPVTQADRRGRNPKDWYDRTKQIVADLSDIVWLHANINYELKRRKDHLSLSLPVKR